MKRKAIIMLLKLGWSNEKIKLHSPSITDSDINKIRNDKRFKWNNDTKTN